MHFSLTLSQKVLCRSLKKGLNTKVKHTRSFVHLNLDDCEHFFFPPLSKTSQRQHPFFTSLPEGILPVDMINTYVFRNRDTTCSVGFQKTVILYRWALCIHMQNNYRKIIAPVTCTADLEKRNRSKFQVVLFSALKDDPYPYSLF